jgi:hypothetical protein
VIDTAGFAYAFWSVIAAIAGLVIAACICEAVRTLDDGDDEDEIVERKRLNLIVRWPK